VRGKGTSREIVVEEGSQGKKAGGDRERGARLLSEPEVGRNQTRKRLKRRGGGRGTKCRGGSGGKPVKEGGPNKNTGLYGS